MRAASPKLCDPIGHFVDAQQFSSFGNIETASRAAQYPHTYYAESVVLRFGK